jgi:glutamate-5-semialdehyde dehydrogenase
VVGVRELAERAKTAARTLSPLGRSRKDAALLAIARGLREEVESVGRANGVDLERARSSGLSAAMIDRLTMGAKAVEVTARGVEHVVSLPDPVGSRSAMQRLPNGLLVGRQRLPLGVVAMVYESRPNVTVDAAALCLKSGNAVLLRAGLPQDAVQIVPATDHDGIRELVQLTGLIDLAIPRGGEGLIRFVTENARVPVVEHYKGVCHLYLDEGCEHDMAERLALNGKTQRPGVCNALECLLVHEREAPVLLPRVASALVDRGVELRGCPRTLALVPAARPATEEDWGREFLSLVLAVRVVPDLDAALDHIARYGSKHTEAICTRQHEHAERWLSEVDASCVLVNASTRFNDGGELGLGAEIGISTSKLHAYGPMGLESLTAEKWIVLGAGQVRQ